VISFGPTETESAFQADPTRATGVKRSPSHRNHRCGRSHSSHTKNHKRSHRLSLPMGLLSKAHTHVALLDHPAHKTIVLALITHLGVADCAVLFIHLIQHMNRPQLTLSTIAIAVCLIATQPQLPSSRAGHRPMARTSSPYAAKSILATTRSSSRLRGGVCRQMSSSIPEEETSGQP
jgi:hypothetical protein